MIPTEWESERGRVLFPMPLIAGGPTSGLSERHGPLPPLFVAELLRQLLSALVVVHGEGLIHRDIRPGNLLLDATGANKPHLYLSDFAHATEIDGTRVTRVGHVLSNPTYMAPELRSGTDPEPATDLWAVGAVAEELLTGKPPQGRTIPHLPVTTPALLVDFIAGLLSPVPSRRPNAAHAVEILGAQELTWRAEDSVDVPSLYDTVDLANTASPGDGDVTGAPAAPRDTPPPRNRSLMLPVGGHSAAVTTTARPAASTVTAEPVAYADLPRRPAGRPTAPLLVSTATPSVIRDLPPVKPMREPEPWVEVQPPTHLVPERSGDDRRRRAMPWRWLLIAAATSIAVLATIQFTARIDSSNDRTAPGTSGSPSTGASGNPNPTAAASPSSAGQLDTHTVVLRVGQPCLEAGATETTIDGLPVKCLNDGNRLAWLTY